MNDKRRNLELMSRAAFDESVRSLDAATRSRLASARERALAGSDRPGLGRAAIWIPATAASALVAAVVWRMHDPDQAHVGVARFTIEELHLLPAEDFEILQEEEGFYAWAAEQMSGGVG
jgi:hypothetical protein